MTAPTRNSRWIRKDLNAANNAAFRDSFFLGDPNDYWTLDGAALQCAVRPAPGHPTLIVSMGTADNSMIVLDPHRRWIQFNVPAATLSAKAAGTYYYDLLVTGIDGFTYRRMAGHFLIHQGIAP